MNKYEFDYSSKTKPYPHQSEAINFIVNKENIPLFDEQGLGKTKIVIDALCRDIETGFIDGAIIICKKSLLNTWESEIKKHSHLTFITLRGSTREKGYKFHTFAHFYLINYELLASEIKRLKMFLEIHHFAMVLDESHKIKDPMSRTAQMVFQLRECVVKRIIITGTPIANRLEDLWAQFYFLDGGKTFGSDYYSFKKEYGMDNLRDEPSQDKIDKMEEIKTVIHKMAIRRLKNQVLELPDKRFFDEYVFLSGRQLVLYNKIRNDLQLEFHTITGEEVIEKIDNILEKLLRLVQITSNPRLIDRGYQETPIKFFILDRLVKEIIQKGEKVIIWTSFINNISELKKRYMEHTPLAIYGEIPIALREKYIQRFQEDIKYPLLIANPAAAREGITLTGANNAIYLDRNFNLIDYIQSQDRIHRISQIRPCNIIKLVAKNTIDEYIDYILYIKEDIAKFIQGDIDVLEKRNRYLTKEEILIILGGNPNGE